MVDLDHHRGPTTIEPFDHGHLPERARVVERLTGLLPGQAQEVGQGTRGRQLDPPEVVVEDQVAGIDPSRNTCPPRLDPLA